MLKKLKGVCDHIDISGWNSDSLEEEFDFDSLIPETEGLSSDELEQIAQVEEKQRRGQGTDKIPMEIFNGLLEHFLYKHDYRSVLWLTLQANTGLRYIDVVKLRRIDLMNENNKFRDSVLRIEQKTGKKRRIFLNKAIKMATLMYLWENPEIKPLDLLITAGKNARYKGYELETYIDCDGKERAVRVNGKYVYKLDEHGNKVPKPLSRSQACTILRNALVCGLGISIKNDKRTKNNEDAYLKLASHSLRKTYADVMLREYLKIYGGNEIMAREAAMEQLQYDFNHSSKQMSYFYTKEQEDIKRTVNENMNIGLEILKPYFEEATIQHLAKINT